MVNGIMAAARQRAVQRRRRAKRMLQMTSQYSHRRLVRRQML